MSARFFHSRLLRHRSGSAAAEMALITPLLMALMFGSAELGNWFLTNHAVIKQVRDGARFGSRLTLNASYACQAGALATNSTVFQDGSANTKIINVTKTGSVDGTASGRFGGADSSFWTACNQGEQPVSVSVRCVPKGSYAGLYTDVSGSIPVVSVTANVQYPSILGNLGINTAGLCVTGSSEAAVVGI
ncbi:TadE/TadG family type IV pilus assembly protein [Sphingomonas sp. LHG3406-1]|uniref:TadE/TadG family type IV pilus assembly protein n=1 Tax=Sphingomonas sp. LHG3406-1 TaxID=2804617 RepID=UPI00261034CF|nr:TadE/TadG family type IV pilus assembly protein [Sphingomonas sp. LHG3406-1]